MDLNQVLETGKFQQVLCEICEWDANWTKPQVSFCENLNGRKPEVPLKCVFVKFVNGNVNHEELEEEAKRGKRKEKTTTNNKQQQCRTEKEGQCQGLFMENEKRGSRGKPTDAHRC